MENNSQESLFVDLIDARYGELQQWGNRQISDESLRTYLDVLLAYRKRDELRLEEVVMYMASDKYPVVFELSEVRLRILNCTVNYHHVNRLLALLEDEPAWRGEIYYVCAEACQTIGNEHKAMELYLDASLAFEDIGAHRKSEKAHLKHVLAKIESGFSRSEFVVTPKIVSGSKVEEQEIPDAPQEAVPRRLTRLENRLLEQLIEAPKTKFELVESLYGMGQDFSSAENRLKVLISRLRKKHPGTISLVSSKYSLAAGAYN